MPFRWTLTNLKTLDFEELSADPVGWDESVYTIKRSEKYNGLMHEFTSPLQFHCQGGGKQFVDGVFDADGIDGRIDILVEYDCDGSGTYENLFHGILDLASYKIDNDYTICQIERSDLLTKFITRDEISVDLETTTSIGGETITAPAAVNVPMHPVSIPFSHTWRAKAGAKINYQRDYSKQSGTPPAPIFYPRQNGTQIETIIEQDKNDPTFLISGLGGNADESPNFGTFGIQPLLTVKDSGVEYPITVNWQLDWHVEFHSEDTSSGSRNVQYWFSLIYGKLGAATEYQVLTYQTSTTKNFTTTVDLSDSGTINLNAGESIWLVWYGYESPQTLIDAYVEITNDSYFKIDTKTGYKSTPAKNILAHEAFNQVVDAIADTDGNFYSEFYGRTDSEKQAYAQDGCGSLIGLTNGLNLRLFADKKIYASFNEIFAAFNCIHNIGAGYENSKIRVEPLSYWFDKTTKIISLPFVNKINSSNLNDKYFNKIAIGFSKWQTEFAAGIDEVNATHEYSTIVKSTKNIYSQLCQYIAGSYAIESARRKSYYYFPDTDYKYDNDNFFVAVRKENSLTDYGFFIGPDTIAFVPTFEVQIGDSITVAGSASNDGTYTVTNVIYSPGGATQTSIVVSGTITTETPPLLFTITNNTRDFFVPEKYTDSFSSGSGMVALDTAYNLRLTPKRMLLAHLNVITAGLQKIQGDIAFVKGEGNTGLTLTKTDVGCQEDYSGQPLEENKNLAWNSPNAANIAPLFLPIAYSFEYPLTYTQFKTIKSNPNGYIEFYRFENDKKAGFIMNMEYNLKTGMASFELLATVIDG